MYFMSSKLRDVLPNARYMLQTRKVYKVPSRSELYLFIFFPSDSHMTVFPSKGN